MLCIEGSRRVRWDGGNSKSPSLWKHYTILPICLVPSLFTSKLMAMIWPELIFVLLEVPFMKGKIIFKNTFMIAWFYGHQTTSCASSPYLLPALHTCKTNMAIFWHMTVLLDCCWFSFRTPLAEENYYFKQTHKKYASYTSLFINSLQLLSM